MTSFINVFGGGIPPSELRYVAYSISANGEFVWPENYNGSNGLLVASIVEVTATVAALDLTLPPADSRSVGEDFIIRNVGAESIEIIDQDLNSLTTIPAGEVKAFYITDNTTEAGEWGIFDYGAGTSSADASALAGFGLRVWAAKLVPDHAYITKNANYTIDVSDRNKLINFITGTSIATMPPAADVEAGFHVLIRNSSLGTITVDGNAAEPVDGGLTKELSPNESAIFVSDGGGWYSVGYGRDVEFTFSEFVVNAAAGDVVLSSSDVAGRMIRVSGTAVADIEVTLPATDNIYFVNVENGMGAFTATFTTGSGDVAELSASDRTVLYSDGTNVQVALTTALVTTLSLADGSSAAPSISFNLDPDTGIFRPGANTIGFSSNGTQAAAVVPAGLATANGSAAAPSLTFLSDQNTGFYRQAEDQIAVSVNGARIGLMTAAGYFNVAGSAAIPSYKFLTDEDTGLYSLGGGIIGFAGNGVVAATITGGSLVNGIRVAAGGGDEFPAYSFIDNSWAGVGFVSSPSTLFLCSGGSGFGEVSISQTKVNINFGNLEFGSALASQQRIRGNFSEGVASERVLFQSNVTDGVTAIGVIPNGTATTSSIQLGNAADPDNQNRGIFRSTATSVDLVSVAVGTGVLRPMQFIMGALSVSMSVLTTGNVQTSRFLKIGDDAAAPLIKTKKLTGTTNAAAGGTASVAHGLTSSKIIGAQVLVGASAGTRVYPGSPIAANAYQVHHDTTNFVITNGASSGATINNQPFSILVTYEE